MDIESLRQGYIQRSMGNPGMAQQQPEPRKKNFWLDQISTAGGIVGGIAGLPLGILGAGGGAAIGSGLGETLENALTGDPLTKNVGKEAALGGVFGAGPLKLLRGGGRLAAGAIGKGAGAVAGEAGEGVGKRALTIAQDKATTNLLKLTPAQTQKLLDAGVDPTKLAKRAAQFGGRADEIIGRTGNSGPLQSTIQGLEAGITTTARTAGRNVRIPGDELIKGLRAEARLIKKELGGGPRLKAINQIIRDAESKYANGVTVQQARNILREANQRFGASVLDDTGDAVARAAQKLEANTMRSALRQRFPSIGSALDDEGELIQLREILKRARAVDQTGKFNSGRLDLTRPGTFVDPIVNSRRVSQRLLGAGSTTPRPITPPSPRGMAVRQIGQNVLIPRGEPQDLESALVDPQSPGDVNSSMSNPSTMTEMNMPMNQNMDTLNPETAQQSSPYSRENLMSDIQRDPSNADKYIAYYQSLEEIFNPQPEAMELNNTAIARISDYESGIQALGELESRIGASGANAPVIGNLRRLNPLDTEAQDLNSVIRSVRQLVGKALEGGVLRREDEIKYQEMLPKIGDTDATARAKIANVRRLLESNLTSFMQNSQRFGGGGSLEDVLTAPQPAY